MIVIGKANMCEALSMIGGGSDLSGSTIGGIVQSPTRLDCPVGGSSSGSAVGVKAGFCTASLGTDSNGSLVSSKQAVLSD